MRPSILALLGALTLGSGATQAGTAQVAFSEPQHFTDAALRGGVGERALKPALDGLTRIFERLAAERLPADAVLKVIVTDVDLAGRIEPWRIDQVRILRGVDWPRIALRYSLEQGGRVVASGEERVADLNYQLNARIGSSDPLFYERAMLQDWFRNRFPAAQPPA